MDMLTGGQLVARMLKKEGVGTVFTLSGLHVAPIYVGLVEEGIRIVDTRHEQAAAHAADAWARLTRGMGVAIVTAGPGVTDAVTGVANAWAANVPLLLIGGAAPTFNQGRGSLQEMPQTQLFQGITKWSDRVPSPELLPSYLAKAFRVARAGRPGPVFLEIPWDVLSNGADASTADQLTGYRTDARSPGDPRKIEDALALLAGAERPVVLGGSSIWWDDAPQALDRFATRTGIPVYLNGMGRGCLPPGHPCFFQHTRKEALGAADVVLVVGTPLDFRVGYGSEPTFASGARVIQVDVDAAEIGRNRPIDAGIVGDSRSVLAQLESGAKAVPGESAWRERLRASEARRLESQAAFEQSGQRPIHHFRLGKEIDLAARRAGDVTFVADGGNVVAVAAKSIQLPRPGRVARPGAAGLPGRGRALRAGRQDPRPGAAGAGHPGRRVVRPERLRLRDRGPLQAPHGRGGRQRRRLGADPHPPAEHVRGGQEPGHAARLHPLRPGGRGLRRQGGARGRPGRPARRAGPRLRLRDRLLCRRRHRPGGRRVVGRRRLRRLIRRKPCPHRTPSSTATAP